ncbi:MAG: hypothetical protein AB7I18_07035 [Candidatus Berkiella sp.]
MKITVFLLGMSLCVGLIPLTSIANVQESGKQGTILQFNIEGRSMLINDKEYTLSDRLQVVTKSNIAGGDMLLKNGQAIEFWLDTDTQKERHVEKGKENLPMIKRIRILSDVKMNY